MTEIFDFHLHPGYDFHADVLTPEAFVNGLKAHGITACAGSVIHKGDSNRDLADHAKILPRLNREAYEMQCLYPDFFSAGIHIHPAFVTRSCEEIAHYAQNGVRLVGELVPYLMGWRDFADTRLWEILEVADKLGMVLNFHPNKRPDDMLALVRQFPHLQIPLWVFLSLAPLWQAL